MKRDHRIIKINIYNTMLYTGLLILTIHSVTTILIQRLIPNGIIRLMTVLLADAFILAGVRNRKRKFQYSDFLIILLGLITHVGNYYLTHGYLYELVLYDSILLIMVVLSERVDWYEKVVGYIHMFCMIYCFCTIWFYFDKSFYMSHIVPLFPEAENKLVVWYNNGWMAGLTSHYSTNGTYTALAVMIGGVKLMSNDCGGTWRKNRDIFIELISIIALLMTGKRAHVLFSAFALLVTYYAYAGYDRKKRLLKIMFISICGILTAVLLVTYVPALANFLTRFQIQIQQGNIASNRFMFWGLAWKQFLENPVFGIGWKQFHMLSYQKLNYIADTHNIYLQLLCETGVIGTVIYVSWFSYAYVRSMKTLVKNRGKNIAVSMKRNLLIILTIQTFFLIYGLTGNPLYDMQTYFIYFLSCIAGIYYAKYTGKE